MVTLSRGCSILWLAACALGAAPSEAEGQRDSQTVVAGARYKAGSLRRFLLGSTYREEWTTPVRVPVIDLARFAGGLTPTRAGGGNTTRNLRFDAGDGQEYVFRLVDKDKVPLPDGFEGTVVEAIGRDQVSANHPAAALVAARLLDATDIHHVRPVLALLPDDARLGEFRKEFAGRLGMIEVYPTSIGGRGSITESVTVIETDSLRRLLDASPANRVDATAYLAARLMDMLMNDWDRHPGNWKWVRPAASRTGAWAPWPRDRDKAFISFGGLVHMASFASANFVAFDSAYPPLAALTWNSEDLDRRLLAGVEGGTVDSVAADLVKRISDSVIGSARDALPLEYQDGFADIGPVLEARRDQLPVMARRFYLSLAQVVDVHGSDAADVAIIERMDNGDVGVRIESPPGKAWFSRRFRHEETREVRIYLHGGDDRATVRGDGPRSISLRVIGGSGRNKLTDSSTAAGKPHPTALYDNGEIGSISYGKDTLFDRRPWQSSPEGMVPPGRDRGSALAPVAGINGDVDYGVTFKLGAHLDRHGFRRDPWASRFTLVGEYATEVNGFRLSALVDTRAESSTRRLLFAAQMSELEVINFFGYGNDTPDAPPEVARVRQSQWTVSPGVGFAPMAWTTVTVAPVLRYVTTGEEAGTIVTEQAPYGLASTGQVGLQAAIRYERGNPVHGTTAVRLRLAGAVYPGVWDLEEGYSTLDASASVLQVLPLPTHTAVFAGAQARKAFGQFPYYDAATVGGFGSIRSVTRQRYAGDAALAGTLELRQPIASFPLVIPLNIGVYGFGDAGRVYMDGATPGGWHAGAGAGLWIGFLNTANTLVLEYGRRDGADVVWVRTGLSF